MTGQILARVVDGHVEFRFETFDGKVVHALLGPTEFAAFCQAISLLADELWPPEPKDSD